MRRKLLSILVLSILGVSTLVECGGGQPAPSLIILSITGGNLSIMKAGTGSWTPAQTGVSLEVGDTIKSGDNSNAEIVWFDGTTIELQAGTEIEVASLSITDTGSITIVLKQTIGSIIFRVTKIIDPASHYEVKTPTGAVMVRGSAMQVSVGEDGTTWACNLEGDIWAVAQGVELQVPQGMCCIIRPGQIPELIMRTSESDRASTPTAEDYVLASNSTIMDCAVGDDGDAAYAIVEAGAASTGLLKSDDYAATWEDITDALVNQVRDDGYTLDEMLRVVTDGADPHFLAVALTVIVGNYTYAPLHVYISTDGGNTFVDAGEIDDSGLSFDYGAPNDGLSDLAVSPDVGGKRDIAASGIASDGDAALFRCTVIGSTAGAWQDATAYPGWDDGCNSASFGVTFVEFSPSWATDKTILVTTVGNGSSSYSAVYLQCGSWGTPSPGWNDASALGIYAVPIIDNVPIPTSLFDTDGREIAGLTMPSDYNSTSADMRVLWVWVNYWDPTNADAPSTVIMCAYNDNAYPVARQVESGTIWLTNVSYYGTIAEGKAIAGMLGTGGFDYLTGSYSDLFTNCEPVQVYRNDNIYNMDICCVNWQKACKPPTGETAMAVEYVSQDKAYAVALDGLNDYDEGAWSVSFDGGNTWNQLSLIDTHVDYFSDVTVSPDCNKTWLVTINGDYGCRLDSVWLKATDLPEAEEYSGYWLRVWNGDLTGEGRNTPAEEGFIRLPADETAGDTVFLVNYDTNYVFMNGLEGLGCWTPITSTTLTNIVDLTATDAETVYALGYYGNVSMYDSGGWHPAVDSKINARGWSIAVHGANVLVGGQDGAVSYSNDGGDTFVALEDIATSGSVTVAFDSYFDLDHTIYAALGDAGDYNGVYRWVIGESTEWENICGLTH